MKNQPKHTKGPFTVKKSRMFVHKGKEEGRYAVASKDGIVAKMVMARGRQECKYNAYLFAAGDRMLEALEAVVADYEKTYSIKTDGKIGAGTMAMVERAIAKAKNSPPRKG